MYVMNALRRYNLFSKKGRGMINLRNLFKNDKELEELECYFECEDSVEAALNYLDNHPDCTLEEYEEWLSHREKAIKEIEENRN